MDKNKKLKVVASVLIILVIISGIWWITILRKAHSSFENYYSFRGCAQLLNRTDDSGLCRISSGKTIKLVKFNDRWYLDGDLPTY
ncbi:MAG: hypothetical protein M1155_01250 [Patescibacteria group bacterium]|nr:hypothetical protein [Patescibacteria group bacterium]